MRNPAMKCSVMRARVWLVTGLVLVSGLIHHANTGWAADATSNAIVSIGLTPDPDQTTVVIQTDLPIGYRYTVYDSFDPIRVVVDFPGMDVSRVAQVITPGAAPVQEIRVSSLALTSGSLGRVELLLQTSAKYNVSLTGNEFSLHSRTSLLPAVPFVVALLWSAPARAISKPVWCAATLPRRPRWIG
jgi:type IV pilus assembly protein PilQ